MVEWVTDTMVSYRCHKCHGEWQVHSGVSCVSWWASARCHTHSYRYRGELRVSWWALSVIVGQVKVTVVMMFVRCHGSVSCHCHGGVSDRCIVGWVTDVMVGDRCHMRYNCRAFDSASDSPCDSWARYKFDWLIDWMEWQVSWWVTGVTCVIMEWVTGVMVGDRCLMCHSGVSDRCHDGWHDTSAMVGGVTDAMVGDRCHMCYSRWVTGVIMG